METIEYSIIIPTLTKTEQHVDVLETALNSVIATKTDKTEIILVDDGSTIHEPLERNKILCDVVIRHKENKGIAASWNDGLKVARGEYLVVINDDIEVRWGWLQGLKAALEQKFGVAAPGVVNNGFGSGIAEGYKWFPGYCFMLNRRTLEKIGFFDEQFSPFNYEDTDYWTRVLKAGGKLWKNFDVAITHKEGDVLHTLDYDAVSEINKEKFVKKHGFDPLPIFYGNKDFQEEIK